MSYNPRIRNKRNNVIQVTGSVVSVTGAISAVGNISTSGTVTGSVGLFTTLTASIISASQYFGLPPGNGTGDVSQAGNNTFTGINTFNTNYITASSGITGSDAKFISVTGSLLGTASYATNAGNASTVTNGVYTNTANTFNNINTFNTFYVTASVTGSDAKFISITGTLLGTASYATNADNANTVTNGVYTNTISTLAVTSITGGNGLTVTGTVGSVTLDIGQGDGITVNADDISVDNTVVRISGNQQISGIKDFTSALSGTYAYFSNDVRIIGTASIGTLNTVNQTSLVIGDKYITILSGGVDHASLDGSGFLWGSGSTGPTVNELGSNAHVRYRNTSDTIEIFPGLSVSGGVGVQIVDKLSVTGSSTFNSLLSGTTAQFTSITGTLLGTASYATNAGNASTVTNGVYTNTANTFSNVNTFNSFYVTASVTGSDAKFTSITGTLNGLATNVLLVSTDTTLTSNNHVILASASLSNITITLPLAASSPYRQYVIKKTDSNSSKIIVSGTSGQTIDGNLGREINTQYETVTLINNGISEWFIL